MRDAFPGGDWVRLRDAYIASRTQKHFFSLLREMSDGHPFESNSEVRDFVLERLPDVVDRYASSRGIKTTMAIRELAQYLGLETKKLTADYDNRKSGAA